MLIFQTGNHLKMRPDWVNLACVSMANEKMAPLHIEWKVESEHARFIVWHTLPEMSSSYLRETVSVKNKGRELNETLFREGGQEGAGAVKGCCISIICQAASPSVCLPHSIHNMTNSSQKEHVSDVQEKIRITHLRTVYCDQSFSSPILIST